MEERIKLAESLGLYGWDNLEVPLLAALASEDPVLLVGPHGTAKTQLLEKLANLLGLVSRFYNASLLNYDDLVGIPVLNEKKTALEYLPCATSVWDAEIVFFDEVNRTRPELQNKLFPIIHERRVQGIDLPKLRYRWAAMNPYREDEDGTRPSYLGTYPLDPALADRFPYVMMVPALDELEREDIERMLLGKKAEAIDLPALVERTKEEAARLEREEKEKAASYLIDLLPLLQERIGYVSARRMRQMERSLLYVHAALRVLRGEDKSLYDASFSHILSAIPNIANEEVSYPFLSAAVEQAWKYNRSERSAEKDVLREKDPAQQALLALRSRDELGSQFLSETLLDDIGRLPPYQRRAVAFLSYRLLRGKEDLPAIFMETVREDVQAILTPAKKEVRNNPRSSRALSRASQIALQDQKEPWGVLLGNYLQGGVGTLFKEEAEVEEAASFFRKAWKEARA